MHGKTPRRLGFCSVPNCSIAESDALVAGHYLPGHCHSSCHLGDTAHLSDLGPQDCRMRTAIPAGNSGCSYSIAEINFYMGGESGFR